jgi:hypothetical protein
MSVDEEMAVRCHRIDVWILRHADVRQVTRLRLITESLARAILTDRDLFECERPFQTA